MDFTDDTPQLDELTKKRLRAAVAVGLWCLQAAYIVFPFDLLPDFIPVIGWLDDLATLGGLSATTLWMLRLVQEVGIRPLLGMDAERVEVAAYEPIPNEVLRDL